MARWRAPPSQGWKTFLRNHADGIVAMDLFVVPTISFRLLYGLLIMSHGRRQILWFGVTAHPTAEWIANQLTEAWGWEQIPRYLIRDRDRAYGEIFVRRVRSIGIRDRPTSFRSPWQNAYAERLIGSIRRECVDHIVVFGERHLRHVLLSYMDYYNATRRDYCLPPDPGRSPSSICPDLICDKDTRSTSRSSAAGIPATSAPTVTESTRTNGSSVMVLQHDNPNSRKMLKRGNPPDTWKELLAAASGESAKRRLSRSAPRA